MTIRYPDLPGWDFAVEEVSVGIYEVSGRDRHGQFISDKGSDVDGLLRSIRAQAASKAWISPAARAQVSEQLEACREAAVAESAQGKDPHAVIERLRESYLSLTPTQQAAADQAFSEWVGSDDEARRFDAIALIGELRIVRARAALQELERRLASDRSPGSPFEIARIRRVLGMLDDTTGKQ